MQDISSATSNKPKDIPKNPASSKSSSAIVKMSDNDICYEVGDRDYEKTEKFTSYPDIEACEDAGGVATTNIQDRLAETKAREKQIGLWSPISIPSRSFSGKGN